MFRYGNPGKNDLEIQATHHRPADIQRSRTGRVLWFTVFAGILISFTVQCSAPRSEDPVIADTILVKVLIDLHLLEARLAEGHQLSTQIRDSVFARHQTDSLQYAATMQYYSDRPEAFASLYSRVIERLNTERSPIQGLLEQASPLRD